MTPRGRTIFPLFVVFAVLSVGKAMAHNHTPFHGGQVGMSGDSHIEFVAMPEGEYRLYITDIQRIPVDISNATGVLTINPDGSNPESLKLLVVQPSKEFLLAKGKTRKKDEVIIASAKVAMLGQEDILVEFQETIGKLRKSLKIKKFEEFICPKGHLFSSIPERKICPFDGTQVESCTMFKKVYE